MEGYSNKEECEYYGGIWVESHRRRDGTRVEGYCRGRDRDEGMYEKLYRRSHRK